MAIAALFETDGKDWAPTTGAPAVRAWSGPSVVPGPSVAARRHRPPASAPVRRRRRRLALGTLVGGLVAGLALPLSATAGIAGTVVPRASAPVVVGQTVYVVQPGDTLWSIAERFDGGGDPRPFAEALAHEIGSDQVVAGERIAIP